MYLPCLHEECLKVVGNPRYLLIGGLHCEEHIFYWYHRSLWDSAHTNGYLALMLLDNILPTSTVKQGLVVKVGAQNFLSLIYHFKSDPSAEVFFEDVLQAKEDDLRMQASPTLEVGLQMGQSWRVLQVMCHLKEDGRENTHSNHSICDSCTSFDNYNHYLVGVCTQEKVVLHVSLALLLHPFLLLEEEADNPCE